AEPDPIRFDSPPGTRRSTAHRPADAPAISDSRPGSSAPGDGGKRERCVRPNAGGRRPPPLDELHRAPRYLRAGAPGESHTSWRAGGDPGGARERRRPVRHTDGTIRGLTPHMKPAVP